MKKYDISTFELGEVGQYSKVLSIPKVRGTNTEVYINSCNCVLDIYWIDAWTNRLNRKFAITLKSVNEIDIELLTTCKNQPELDNALGWVNTANSIDIYVKQIKKDATVYVNVEGTRGHLIEHNLNVFSDISSLNVTYSGRDGNLEELNMLSTSLRGSTYTMGTSGKIKLPKYTSSRCYLIHLAYASDQNELGSASVVVRGTKVNSSDSKFTCTVENGELKVVQTVGSSYGWLIYDIIATF